MLKQRKNSLVIIFVLLLTATAVYYFFLKKETAPNNGAVIDANSSTTSTEPSAQPNFTSGEKREPGNALGEDEGYASIQDISGSSDKPIDKSKSLTSDSGEITLFEPKANALVSSGIRIAGETSLSSVSYRVVDSRTGVISIGELSVKNGKFSGLLTVETGATEGRLDIFGLRSDGNEFSNIAVPLRFK